MLSVPTFEKVAIVGDSPTLVAQLASLFVRPGRYLPIVDGPRMGRASDATNEVIRRVNALVAADVDLVLLAGLADEPKEAMARAWRPNVQSHSFEELATNLKGRVKRRTAKLAWGQTNLGVGLYLARSEKLELQATSQASPNVAFVEAGKHLLVACEDGNELSQVIASNVAFASNASFLVFPALAKQERENWLDDLYALGEGGDVSGKFAALRDKARARLPDFPFEQYTQVLFVTSEFPWGIAVPECATTHMYDYPDFGRSVLEGLWAAQSPKRSARTALLIDPEQVEGSEIRKIAHSLAENRTLIRVQRGTDASVYKVQTIIDTLPFDIIVISTHAGDVRGHRETYEYVDADGRQRRLIVDTALGLGYDPLSDKYLIQQFHRFHALDGVDWTDSAAKAALPVGTAIASWLALGDVANRKKHVVHSEPIPRVAGSMALRMNDNAWIVMVQGFAPETAPLILNNACSSWHELGKRLTFAGARGYVGTLFPITDAEAQEIGQALFTAHLGQELPRALWLVQNNVYGSHGRRPYAMVGLPFAVVHANTVSSVSYMARAYRNGIAAWAEKAATSPFEDVRANSKSYEEFLRQDFESFRRYVRAKATKPRRT